MKRSRLRAVRAAVVLAAGFVALRVVYRVVFGGTDGSGLVLLDLPAIRLTGPFAHITLLGPVTTGGIAAAASSALPFAALVLVIGLIAAIVDLRALLSRGAVRGPVKTVSRALAVAWATFPALLDSVRRVRTARELRGERGASSLVVPVLEQTVERAVALGASMEVRGFAATRHAQPVCEHPVVVRDAALGYDGRWVLDGLDVTLSPGTLVLVAGATGSGKSTLLHALSGLFQHVSRGGQAGVIEVGGVDRVAVPPRETSGFVGVVSQSARLSFVAGTVSDELGFSLANRGVASVIVRARVEEIADRLGITALLEREIHELSAGEATLVSIGAALVEQPILLLVDEPLAELDESARARVISVLDALAHTAGVCVIVAEHALDGWGDAPDQRLEIRDGRLAPERAVPAPAALARERLAGGVVAEIADLVVARGERIVVDRASLRLRAGAIVALRGANGAGKSSFLHEVARPKTAGAVTVGGRDVHSLSRADRRTAVALVPEQFDDLLFATTVEGECRRADRRAVARSGTASLFARLLGRDLTGDLLARHPRDLSAGERLCLVIAIQLSAAPRVLLVDEPSRGLDGAARELVGRALVEAADAGAAVVFATHDRAFADRFADSTVTMAEGRLDAPAEVTR